MSLLIDRIFQLVISSPLQGKLLSLKHVPLCVNLRWPYNSPCTVEPFWELKGPLLIISTLNICKAGLSQANWCLYCYQRDMPSSQHNVHCDVDIMEHNVSIILIQKILYNVLSSHLRMRTNKQSTNHIIQIALKSILFHNIAFCDTK